MNDKKIEMLLKKSLRPDISEDEVNEVLKYVKCDKPGKNHERPVMTASCEEDKTNTKDSGEDKYVEKSGTDTVKLNAVHIINTSRTKKKSRSGNAGSAGRRIIAGVTAAAACAALIITSLFNTGIMNDRDKTYKKSGSYSSTSTDTSHAFTIKAMAKETGTATGAVIPQYSDDKKEKSFHVGEDRSEKTKSIFVGSSRKQSYYELYIPFYCTGDNISSVKYSLSKGVFKETIGKKRDGQQVEEVYITDDGIGYSSPAINDEASLEAAGKKSENKKQDTGYAESFMKSYSVDYDDQKKEESDICICGFSDIGLDKTEKYYISDDPAVRAKIFNKILDGLKVYYEVSFTDGTVKKGSLDISAKAETFLEAGEAESTDAAADRKEMFIVVKGKKV